MKLILSIVGTGVLTFGIGANIAELNWWWIGTDLIFGGTALYFAYAVLE